MSSIMTLVHERKLITVLVFAALVLATFRDWYWMWGLLFLFWSVQGLQLGHVFLIEDITRDEHAVLFWLISAMWAGFGLWYVYADLVWRL